MSVSAMKAVPIAEVFELEHGGPNPYFRCKLCKDHTEPALLEYLAAHMATHGLEPQVLTKGAT